MKDFVYQINKHECGFASLKMMLATLYRNESYLYLKHPYPNNHMYTLLELKNFAKKYGLFLGGYIVNNLNDIIRNKKPFILIKTLENGNKHAIYIRYLSKHFAIVYDPDLGKKITLTKKLFMNLASGVDVLLIEGFTPKIDSPKINPLIPRAAMAKIIGLEIVAILSYFFGCYFIDENYHFLYPVILMVIGVIFTLLNRISVYKTMNTFDETYIKCTYNLDPKVRYKNYQLMHITKSGLLATSANIMSTFASAIAVNTILILNSHYSVFIIICSFLLVAIDSILITPRVKKMSSDLAHQENDVLSNEKLSENEYQNEYQEIKEKTYKIARIFDLKKIVMIFILLMVVLFVSGITENASVYFVLFYFAVSVFTYLSFENVNNLLDKNKENIINQTKFYELINEENLNKDIISLDDSRLQ